MKSKIISDQARDKLQTQGNGNSQGPLKTGHELEFLPPEDVEQEKHSGAYESAAQAQIPLTTVLALIQSEKFGQQTIRNLAGTTPLSRQLQALSDLWQSL